MFNLKTGEFSGKSSSTIYFDFKYSTPLFLLENLKGIDRKLDILNEDLIHVRRFIQAYDAWANGDGSPELVRRMQQARKEI